MSPPKQRGIPRPRSTFHELVAKGEPLTISVVNRCICIVPSLARDPFITHLHREKENSPIGKATVARIEPASGLFLHARRLVEDLGAPLLVPLVQAVNR